MRFVEVDQEASIYEKSSTGFGETEQMMCHLLAEAKTTKRYKICKNKADLFSRRFREGISFPNFVERCIPELPLSKLCSVPFSLQNRALFEGGKRAKRCREKGRKRVASKGGKKEKRTRENRSEGGGFDFSCCASISASGPPEMWISAQ